MVIQVVELFPKAMKKANISEQVIPITVLIIYELSYSKLSQTFDLEVCELFEQKKKLHMPLIMNRIDHLKIYLLSE